VGYLPIQKQDRKKKIRELENQVRKSGQTQIFIETPYRNKQLLEDILHTCSSSIRLCIGCNISAETGWVKTYSIEKWKKTKVDFHKVPSIFLLGN